MKNNKLTKYIKEKTKELAQSFSKGFTLVETMVAVFIIGMITTSLLGVIATSLYNFRYTQNEMVATYLLQEAADYIRNHRDTEILNTPDDSKAGWGSFITKYNKCRDVYCQIDTTEDFNTLSETCTSIDDCDSFYFNNDPEGDYFYNYDGKGIPTSFKRGIKLSQVGGNTDTGSGDEIRVLITVEWKNGNLPRKKDLVFTLLRWLS